MQRLYASTFVAGAGSVISSALRQALPDASIERLDDGMVIYHSKASPDRMRDLRFFQNTFEVLSYKDSLDMTDPIKSLVKHVREDIQLPSRITRKRGTYKLQATVENQLTALHPIQRQKFEKRMFECGLRPAGQKFECELWLTARREGYGFLGLRLTRHENYDHKLKPGELKPDLANLLCLLSSPRPTDVFLDPMAGSGAIPFERAKSFPYAQIFAGDHDAVHARALKDATKKFKKFTPGMWDVRTLEGIQDASVDAIVTDPPWGKFFDNAELPALYRDMLLSFKRVLKQEGRAVILASREGPLEILLEGSGFLIKARHDILVNGQKARIWVVRKS
jgi:tRNA (guanine6-N2)-methyltransferase